MRERFCRVCGGWHDVEAWPHNCMPAAPVARSDKIPTPMVISDTMEPTEHIDGRFYDSKKKFRQVTKDHGCIEVGNDPARLRQKELPKPDKKANREAIEHAKYLVENKIPVQSVRGK
jgi:hypothetical protein